MSRRLLSLCVFAIILVPSAHFVWKNRSMPQFAYLHDDGILFSSARSLTAHSYRIESLPDQPLQTKFPPLYPLYLSLVWLLNPHFPDNLSLAAFSSAAARAKVCLRHVRGHDSVSRRFSGSLQTIICR